MDDLTSISQRVLQTLETKGLPQQAQTLEALQPESYCSKMKLANENFKQNWINKRLNLDRHHPDLVNLEDAVWNFCRGVAMNPRKGKRYVICGNNGVAKTRCSKAIKRWMSDRAIDLPLVDAEEGLRTADCCMINWAEQVDHFKSGHWSIDQFLEATVLILDDIGAEHDPTKAGVEKLYLILERREQKWTWITTNIQPNHWESHFERRVSDRLFRNSVHVDLTNVPSYSIFT